MDGKPIDPDAGNRIEALLKLNPELYFDESIFRRTCQDIEKEQEGESWLAGLNSLSTVENMLAAVPEDIRGHFLKIYVCHFNRMIGV